MGGVDLSRGCEGYVGAWRMSIARRRGGWPWGCRCGVEAPAKRGRAQRDAVLESQGGCNGRGCTAIGGGHGSGLGDGARLRGWRWMMMLGILPWRNKWLVAWRGGLRHGMENEKEAQLCVGKNEEE